MGKLGVDDLENLKGTHLDKADQGELLDRPDRVHVHLLRRPGAGPAGS